MKNSKVTYTAWEWLSKALERARNPIPSCKNDSPTYDKDINYGCFIGYAMPDNRLKRRNSDVLDLARKGILGVSDMTDYVAGEFLMDIQNIHDYSYPHLWNENLMALKVKYQIKEG